MCTLIVAHRIFNGFPVVVAANRDEYLDRPSEPPRVREGDPAILAPKDLQRGGTWIGVNACGVFAGLTNRADVESRWGKVGRGAIVMSALQHRSAIDAFNDLKSLNGNDMNGFHLIIADREHMFLLKADGKTITQSEEAGLLVATNHGMSNDPRPPKRAVNVLNAWHMLNLERTTPHPVILKTLLDLHDADQHAGTCINDLDNNYGTKSSSIILMEANEDSDEWRYFHREREKDYRHICAAPFNMQFLLPISNP